MSTLLRSPLESCTAGLRGELVTRKKNGRLASQFFIETQPLFATVDPETYVGIQIVKQLFEMEKTTPGGVLAYLDRAEQLLKDAANSVNPFDGFSVEVPDGEKVIETKDFLAAEEVGIPELDKTAFCLVAGGLGERLGYPGIKVQACN